MTNLVIENIISAKNPASSSDRRITGTFYKQEWGGRKNDDAILIGEETFDATDAILLMAHAELIALEDSDETTDDIGRDHVSWSGPCYVSIEDSICGYFGVDSLDDITEEALAEARAKVNPQLAANEVITLAIKVKVRVASGASITKFIENLDYSFTSNTPGVTVRDTEIVDTGPVINTGRSDDLPFYADNNASVAAIAYRVEGANSQTDNLSFPALSELQLLQTSETEAAALQAVLAKNQSKITVSLDGGETFQPATEGVRIIYRDVMIDGEDETGELHINATHESVITDLWAKGECDGPGTSPSDYLIGGDNVGIDVLVSKLVEEND